MIPIQQLHISPNKKKNIFSTAMKIWILTSEWAMRKAGSMLLMQGTMSFFTGASSWLFWYLEFLQMNSGGKQMPFIFPQKIAEKKVSLPN